MKALLVVFFGALSVVAQEMATRAPESPFTPSPFERYTIEGCTIVALIWQVRENKELRAENRVCRDEVKQYGERVAAIAERALERLK